MQLINNDIIDYINYKNIEINNLPQGISISTMCATCQLNKKINIINIEKYLALNEDDILTIDPADKTKKRTLLNLKIKPKRQKKIEKKKKYFYNQITVIIRINSGTCTDINLEKKINLKLFKNGSITMSGCKSVEDINTILNKLVLKLTDIKAILINNIIIEKTFIELPIEDTTIINFKINMINSNYRMNINIDRAKLFELLIKKKIKTIYEPCIRACVIIKYVPESDNLENKEISIFIFQRGNIIITGAKSRNHIIEAYNFTNNILTLHYNDIINYEGESILAIYKNIKALKIKN